MKCFHTCIPNCKFYPFPSFFISIGIKNLITHSLSQKTKNLDARATLSLSLPFSYRYLYICVIPGLYFSSHNLSLLWFHDQFSLLFLNSLQQLLLVPLFPTKKKILLWNLHQQAAANIMDMNMGNIDSSSTQNWLAFSLSNHHQNQNQHQHLNFPSSSSHHFPLFQPFTTNTTNSSGPFNLDL